MSIHTLTAAAVLRTAAVALVLSLWPLATMSADEHIIDPYREHRDEGETGVFDYDDSQDIPWIENETEILALPDDANLRPVNIGNLPPGMTLLIDTSRISVDPVDRVVRLWVVLRSDGGVDNSTYEGYRCIVNQYKVYAHATPQRDPPVSKMKRAAWREVGKSARGNYRRELLLNYFCTIRGVRSAQAIQSALQVGVETDTWFNN
jgi:hypothetical protein